MVRPTFPAPVVRRKTFTGPFQTSLAVLLALSPLLAGCSYRSSSQPQLSDKGATAKDIAFEFKTLPRQPVAGIPCIWDMKVLDVATGKGLKSFADNDGQRLRLAVISADGKEFQLVQPDYKDYGHFVTQGIFASSGSHRAFAFFTPFGGQPLVKGIEWEIAPVGAPGPAPEPVLPEPPKDKPSPAEKTAALHAKNALQPLPVPASLRPDSLTGGRIEKTAGGLRVALQSGTPRAGATANLTLVVRDAPGGVTAELEPVLGAPAQMVIVDAARQWATAPELLEGTGRHGSPCVFQAVFPRPGLYTVWTVFARGGQKITIPFVLNVGNTEQKETAGGNNKVGN